MNEFEASLIVKAGAEQLSTASADPRSEEGYTAVKANLSEALEHLAMALTNLKPTQQPPTVPQAGPKTFAGSPMT